LCLNGLIPHVKDPTRGANCLDKIFVTELIDCNIKIIKSAVKSDHSAIVFSDGSDVVINVTKQKTQIEFRPKSPAQNARFLEQTNFNIFDSIVECNSLQECADQFYAILFYLINAFYPVKHCTVSSCDPPFLTPEIKSLLRKKNHLMHKNRLQEASAISDKVGNLITHNNSTKLSKINAGGPTMWEEVRRITQRPKNSTSHVSLTAVSLNSHYSTISTDPLYHQPESKLTVPNCTAFVSELDVFNLLDKLHSTASGPDQLPFWFLRVAAPLISRPLTHLINLSLLSSTLPTQWKTAVIHPIPKVPNPEKPSEMRPISVVSVLSRLTERLVVRKYFTPLISDMPALSNQFAYKPTCSTTAALISLLAHITHLLETNSHVIVLTFDYSKAFDTLSHTSVAQSLSTINLPDCIYNWTLDYLTGRTHFTRFNNETSAPANITAGVIQGSVLGPTLFNITASTLSPLSSLNAYFKYADDGYLVVPVSNSNSIPAELQHHSQWAAQQNLNLNMTKTAEIVFSKRTKTPPPPENPGVSRVSCLKILGVDVDNKLSFQPHITTTISNCSQALFALRTLRHHGLPDESLHLTFSSKVLSKLTYASPAWWGFISEGSKDQLEGFLRKATRFNYYPATQPNYSQLVTKFEENLFHTVASNPSHCLHSLLPPLKSTTHNLRKRGHSYSLPVKDDRNFINRLLYRML
jgi:hypothetical protein